MIDRRFFLAILVFLLLPFIALPVKAQRFVDEESTFAERLYMGGNFGLLLGQVTMIEASPAVGYMFNNRFSAGPGIIYVYLRDNRFGVPQSTNIIGTRFFARYNFTENLFGYTELESQGFQRGVLNASVEQQGNRHWVHSPFVGAGYIMRFGARAGLMVMGLYNLHYRPDLGTPYPQPYVLRLGFIF
jgi:hypothetical protein